MYPHSGRYLPSGRHARPQPLRAVDVADDDRRRRWQREHLLLEQALQDERTSSHHRLVLWLIVAFLVLDVLVASGVIVVALS